MAPIRIGLIACLCATSKIVICSALLSLVPSSTPATVGNSFLGEFIDKASNVLHDFSYDEFMGHYVEVDKLLRPIIDASPKNEHGRLDYQSARYALYRVFMERHGWAFKGFDVLADEPVTTALNFSFGKLVPAELGALLDEQVSDGRGASAMELSLYVAMLEKLIVDDTALGLESVYHLKRIPVNTAVHRWQAQELIELYMASYLGALDVTHSNLKQALHELKIVRRNYHNWQGTLEFFWTQLDANTQSHEELSFEMVAHVVKSIVDNFVYWNNFQCSSYKDRLLNMESSVAGSVSLLDFYRYSLKDNGTTFLEKENYLRQLGALDESDPLEPRVLISNYLSGPNNCVAATKYYSVCCMDECADLVSHIESTLGKPAATPAEIIPVVEGLGSASMAECQALPDAVRQELNNIAGESDTVLLHGQSFAQWMHLVYPRECASVEAHGPAHFMTFEGWIKENKDKAIYNKEQIVASVKDLETKRSSEKALKALKAFTHKVEVGHDSVNPRDARAVDEAATSFDKAATSLFLQAKAAETVKESVEEISWRRQLETVYEYWAGLSWTFLFFILSVFACVWKLSVDGLPWKEVRTEFTTLAEMSLAEYV